MIFLNLEVPLSTKEYAAQWDAICGRTPPQLWQFNVWSGILGPETHLIDQHIKEAPVSVRYPCALRRPFTSATTATGHPFTLLTSFTTCELCSPGQARHYNAPITCGRLRQKAKAKCSSEPYEGETRINSHLRLPRDHSPCSKSAAFLLRDKC